MHTVLYRSRARAGLLAPDLNAIIATAEAHNPTIDVTGLLLYGELPAVPGAPGEFVQWIEGPEPAVEGLYARIKADPRHFDVETLARGPVSATARRSGVVRPDGRLFGSWAMGLVRLSELPATLPGFLGFARDWDRTTLPRAA
ncbi:BLUF domain-containing protein [Rubrivirga sp. IMCC45206]|uniref:BLUF domain-containing protein n=1 Tax=Rubrivirga sp. IMCC45206 TaxID=3391614 RepID=UPI0039900FB4